MENNTMEQMLQQYEDSFQIPRKGEVVSGKIVQISEGEIVVNIGYKSDGIIPKSEVSNDPNVSILDTFKEDQEIDVFVIKVDDGDGNVLLSMKKVSQLKDWDILEGLYAEEKEIEVTTSNAVKGGVITYFGEVRGFIPASQLDVKFVRNLEEYTNKTFNVKIIEFNKRRKRVVFSHKVLAQVEYNKKMEAVWGKIAVNEAIEGEVKRITKFGAFVDIGGVDALIHISELSWGRVVNPADVLKIGDKVNALVISADKNTQKISLSIKKLTPDPWSLFESKYDTENVFAGKVVSLTDFGAFVELEPGIEGLVHVSQISNKRVEKPSDELSIAQEVSVKILEADIENKKVKLSIKATL
ncbi:30S ribosomal protein S1 [Helicovermis profundi]|uniref:30S ribosomal protein S1 n=2 Tax=Helicovermis profundi TaxID=3065157 RepID=A0AAU9EHQ5_9FIRM|nr:30S ribosomal protein S1 [Clostridia bacterium S502]